MEYSKQVSTGSWAKAADIKSGTRVRLTTACEPSESTYEGKVMKQDTAKARFEGDTEDKNVRINRPSLNGLIDAFGARSEDWIGKVLTAHTEKMVVGGKRVTAMYFVPEGYEVSEDNGGYLIVGRIGGADKSEASQDEGRQVDEIDVSQIPF